MDPNEPFTSTNSGQVTPHDAFFREAFSNTQAAVDLFQQFLPRDLVAATDWASLRPAGETYLDADLRARSADLLFSAKIGDAECFYYLLLEHKSSPDYWARFQLLELITRIWRKVLDRRGLPKAPLPLIVPMVVYQGPEPWPYPTDFWEYVRSAPELASISPSESFTPSFEHVLVDLSKINWEDFKGHARCRIALRIMKAVCLGQGVDETWRLSELLHSLGQEGTPAIFLEAYWRYLVRSAEIIDLSTFQQILTKLPEAEPKKALMTLEDYFVSKGMEKGIEKGRQEGKREILGAAVNRLSEALGHAVLTPDQLSAMDTADLEKLFQELSSELTIRLK